MLRGKLKYDVLLLLQTVGKQIIEQLYLLRDMSLFKKYDIYSGT